MRVQKLRKKPRHFKSFTGLTIEEFEQLREEIYPLWVHARERRLIKGRPDRVRGLGGGRKFVLKEFDNQLLLVLVWAKLYPTYALMGYLFGVDESTVCRTIKTLTVCSKKRIVINTKQKKIETLEELRELVPEIEEVLIDATEQVTQRPKHKRVRARHHSGKKRAYTLKTQIAVDRRGRIIHVSETIGGRRHDLTLLRQSDLLERLPKGIPIYADGGYDGISKDYQEHTFVLPFRRYRSKPTLTSSEKRFNKKQRRTRTPVENVIAHLKKFRVLDHRYRHDRQLYNDFFHFVAYVVNMRTVSRLTF